MMEFVVEWIAVGAAGLGGLFVLSAAIGVVRMPDLYGRLQASSKAATLGASLALIGCALHFGTIDVLIRVLALNLFLLLTVPLASQLIARAGAMAGAKVEEGATIDEASRRYFERELHADR